jgi:hypothetical protein
MEIFHVQYDCGDYYCDSMHTVGIFSTREKADASIAEYISQVRNALGDRMGDYYAAYIYKVTPRVLDGIEQYGE